MKPAYPANANKAVEAILWLANKQPGIDIYHAVKAAFFADKYHLEKYGRPVCGDAYRAAPYGPLPQVMYGLLQGDPIELIALGGNGDVPFQVKNRIRVIATRPANLRKFSKTDVEALEFGWEHVRGKNFHALFEETHSDPAYINAEGSFMDYRDFISSDDPDRERKRLFIEETASFAIF